MSNCGGRRENAGRPAGQGKYGEPTVSIRVPQSQGATIKDFLDAYPGNTGNWISLVRY